MSSSDCVPAVMRPVVDWFRYQGPAASRGLGVNAEDLRAWGWFEPRCGTEKWRCAGSARPYALTGWQAQAPLNSCCAELKSFLPMSMPQWRRMQCAAVTWK